MDITQAFTDEAFRTLIMVQYCDGRRAIRTEDIEGVVQLQLTNKNLTSLKGLEYFIALEQLDCSYNYLTDLDITRNFRLVSLNCEGNQLLALNTAGNPDLKELNCNRNEIHELNLKGNPALEKLNCGFNRLRKLDVGANPSLLELECVWNMLSDLELAHNQQLRKLNCCYNALFGLELTNHKSLEYLDCSQNYIITLKLDSCESLVELRCHNNHLTELDVSANRRLQSIRCFNNHLTELQVDHPELEELYCSENKLAKLETGHLPKLKRLQYANNLIREEDHTVRGVGTFVYDTSLSTYKASLRVQGQEVYVSVEAASKSEMKRISSSIKQAWESLCDLQEQALKLIAAQHPGEPVAELVLSELSFDGQGMARLGYDAGESPAGHLYIYAVFNQHLALEPALEYEVY